MISSTTKAVGITAAIVAFLGLQGYGFMSMRHTLEDRMTALEQEIQIVREASSKATAQVTSDLGVVSEKIGVTTKDLEQARRTAELLRQEHAKTTKGLREELATSNKAVVDLRQEATSKLEEVHTEAAAANTKIGTVSGEVQTVRTDLDSTKNDLASSRREMGDIRDSLSKEIARNSSEVSELRRRGERDYFEFDVQKTKNMERIADIQVQLKKADMKSKRFDIVLQVDDAKLEKKNHPVNEPILFLVGKDRLRYEMVVFAVDKDRIRGYVSTPKDKTLSAEGPRR